MEIWSPNRDPNSGRCLFFVFFMGPLHARILAAWCYHQRGGVPASGLIATATNAAATTFVGKGNIQIHNDFMIKTYERKVSK